MTSGRLHESNKRERNMSITAIKMERRGSSMSARQKIGAANVSDK